MELSPMQRNSPWMMILAFLAGAQALIIGNLLYNQQKADGPKQSVAKERPATVEAIPNSKLKTVTLTAKAAERLGIKTAKVAEDTGIDARPVANIAAGGNLMLAGTAVAPEIKTRKYVPYGAVLYDLDGTTWVYTNSAPLAYVRQPIRIDYIVGDKATLLEGPAVGTVVVTEGSIELFGAEFKVGH
jgi:hypothetical protein